MKEQYNDSQTPMHVIFQPEHISGA